MSIELDTAGASSVETIRDAVGDLEDPIRRIGRAVEALYRIGVSLHDGKDREAVVALYEHMEVTHERAQAALDAAFDTVMGRSQANGGTRTGERLEPGAPEVKDADQEKALLDLVSQRRERAKDLATAHLEIALTDLEGLAKTLMAAGTWKGAVDSEAVAYLGGQASDHVAAARDSFRRLFGRDEPEDGQEAA